MESFLHEFVAERSTLILLGILAVMLFILAKGADSLVDKAVEISHTAGIPKALIGATIVSLGTTLPEASVSVLAAIEGNAGLALGNAVGSIICDTGLILGLGALLKPLPLDRRVVNRQGWIQLGSGILLILFCLPFSHINRIFDTGGQLPRIGGFIFLMLLVAYFFWSYLAAMKAENRESNGADNVLTWQTISKDLIIMGAAIGAVILSSKVLIVCAEELAYRLNVPESVIAASLVAFGTSLPELVTVMSSIKKGQGELAIGNIIGADILNVLFVAGAAAAVTTGGLEVPPDFFTIHFPVMLGLLIVFRVGIVVCKTHLSRLFGGILLGIYLTFLVANYFV
ncbi:MAG: calcium/sodium antiporter [Verrucomicrobia bacterium]|nr:calcium/sodium antiporter [Verrucomicrobiota bacterium]MDA1064911.1 calcium/sodium antiporter [Verrucomicrobiota bacterium]